MEGSLEMSSEWKEKAVRYLIWLHNIIENREESKIDLVALSDAESSISTGTDDRDLVKLRYERILQEKNRNMERSSRVLPEFETICQTFLPPRLKLSENTIKFWEDNKDTYPSLYTLTEVIFAVPGT